MQCHNGRRCTAVAAAQCLPALSHTRPHFRGLEKCPYQRIREITESALAQAPPKSQLEGLPDVDTATIFKQKKSPSQSPQSQ
eukprot:m.278214 g.278214  ORF g.278214 m.278214 type:complete len:82 (-) comp26941_c0_seq4:257-502(-)